MKDKQDNGPYNIFTETEKTIEFYECDPMGVVWNGNYLNLFEIGRRELLEKIGYNYDDMKNSGYAFPVVEISVKYIGFLKYRDRAIVKAVLMEYENRLRIKIEIRNAQTALVTTKGLSTQMAFDITKYESCFYCPQILIDKVETLIKETSK